MLAVYMESRRKPAVPCGFFRLKGRGHRSPAPVSGDHGADSGGFDLDPPTRRLLRLGQDDCEYALVDGGLDPLRVDSIGKRELALVVTADVFAYYAAVPPRSLV